MASPFFLTFNSALPNIAGILLIGQNQTVYFGFMEKHLIRIDPLGMTQSRDLLFGGTTAGCGQGNRFHQPNLIEQASQMLKRSRRVSADKDAPESSNGRE
jgi:hypothetical protein